MKKQTKRQSEKEEQLEKEAFEKEAFEKAQQELAEAEWKLKTKETIVRWFTDPDTWVGCFSNHDIGHPDLGRKMAIPFKLSDGSFDKAEVHQTKAPDTKQLGFGWRYILEVKARTAEEVFAFYEI